MDNERKDCRNGLFLAAKILGAPGKQQRSAMLLETVRPVWTAFTAEQKGLKSEAAVVQYHIGHCRGAYDVVLRRIFESSRHPAKLDRIGYCRSYSDLPAGCGDVGRPSSQPSARGNIRKFAEPLPAKALGRHAMDVSIAAQQFSFQVKLVKFRGLSELQSQKGLPEQLAFLASDKPADVDEGLRLLNKKWDILLAAESKAQQDKRVAEVLQVVWWTTNVSIREVMVGCAEYNFMYAPAFARHIAKATHRGYGTSAVVENGFKECSADVANVPSKRTGPLRRWHAVACSSVLDTYERPCVSPGEVEHGAQAASVADRIPSAIFNPSKGTPTIDRKRLEAITGAKNWRSYNGQSFNEVALAWHALEWCYLNGCWGRLGSFWQGLVLLEETVVKHKPTGCMYIVVATSAWTSMLWPLGQQLCGNRELLLPSVHESAGPRLFCIDDVTLWAVIPCKAMPPAVLQHELGLKEAPSSVALVRTGGDEEPLRYAASFGFRGLQLHVMRKVAVLLNVPSDKWPNSTLEFAMVLVKAAIPGIGNNELAAMMKGRLAKKTAADDQSIFAVEGTLDMADGVMDDGDRVDCRSHVQEDVPKARLEEVTLYQFLKDKKLLNKADAAMLQDWLEDPAVKAAKAKAARAKGSEKRKLGGWTEAHVRKARPMVTGCWVQRFPQLKRYQAHYPGVCPGSRAKTYGGAISEQQAARHVLLWAWRHHTARTGIECPWDLAL